MVTVEGIAVSPGISVGRVVVLDDQRRRVRPTTIDETEVERHIARLEEARLASLADLERVHAEAAQEMGHETAKVFLFHIGMLNDRSLIDPIQALIREQRVNVEYAVQQVLSDLAAMFGAKEDTAFSTKTDDINDLADRLLAQLQGEQGSPLEHLTSPTIVVAQDLTPSQTAGFDRDHVIGFVTELGGRTSHTAIVANALGLPAMVGAADASSLVRHDQLAILDGIRGVLILDPDEETLEHYHGLVEQRRVFQLSSEEIGREPGVTRDGVSISLVGNIEFPHEIERLQRLGGEGVGLYRTEFLFLASDTEPTEEDHYEAYAECVRELKGQPLTLRTVDLGADKYTQSRAMIPERNPFLGQRSIRYCLANPAMFKRQLRAVLRASALGPIRVMFPLVTTLAELKHAKMLLRDVMEDLDDEGVAYDANIPIGMMVEVPSSALLAESFAREVDFFSIGTNDLVQYTLAVDRTNERVATLYQPCHPAVLKLIRQVVRAARNAKIGVSCCGESAGEVEYALLLIGMGVRTLSVTSGSIPRIKRLIRSVTVGQCERVARKVLTFDSDAEVAAYLRDRARKIVPEAFEGRALAAEG